MSDAANFIEFVVLLSFVSSALTLFDAGGDFREGKAASALIGLLVSAVLLALAIVAADSLSDDDCIEACRFDHVATIGFKP